MMNGNMFLEESFRVRPNFSFKDPSSPYKLKNIT